MFTTINLSRGYYHIPVSKYLQRLFCFETNHQRHAYQTLPQGWASSACLFHLKIVEALAGTPVVSYVDNLIIGGRSREEHDQNLELVLKSLSELNMHLNEGKMQVVKSHFMLLGHDITLGHYNLQTYVNEQANTLPVVSSRAVTRRMLGVFNTCRGTYPDLYVHVKPLKEMLKCKVLPNCGELQNLWRKCGSMC